MQRVTVADVAVWAMIDRLSGVDGEVGYGSGYGYGYGSGYGSGYGFGSGYGYGDSFSDLDLVKNS